MATSYRQSAILNCVVLNVFVCHSYLPYQTLFYCDGLAILHSFQYNYHKKPNNGRKAVILDCFALKVVMSFPYLVPHTLFYTVMHLAEIGNNSKHYGRLSAVLNVVDLKF